MALSALVLAQVGVALAAIHLREPAGARTAAKPPNPEPERTPVPPAATPEPPPPPEPVGNPGLQDRIIAALGGVRACVLVTDASGTLASVGPDQTLAPASTQKLLVAAASLSALGADYRFRTSVVSTTPPREGVVDELWLVGGGDPTLVTPDYHAFLAGRPRWRDLAVTRLDVLADRVAAAGVRRVIGTIHADDSRHEPVRYLPVWKPGFGVQGNIGPLSALTVNGGWATWLPGKTPVVDPRLNAAGALERLLAARGVTVTSPVHAARVPLDAAPIAEIESPPLAQIVVGMLRSSDNLTAELLMREVGLRVTGDGSSAAGSRAVIAELDRLGVTTAGLVLRDGSGLSQGNRTTCRTLVETLERWPGFGDVRQPLAQASRTGTMWRRYLGTPLEGRVWGKTGTISGVTAMTGVVDVGRPVRFAVLLNGVAGAGGRDAEARVLGVIAEASAGRA